MNATTQTEAKTHKKGLTYEVKSTECQNDNQPKMIVKKDGVVVNTVIFFGISPRAAYFYQK